MHARLLVSTAVLVFGTPALAVPDTLPATPTDLTACAYDATSGGICWSCSTGDRACVLGYEITRGDAVVFVRDTHSYIDRALVSGTTYTFGVTAIDNAGQRSGTAVTRLTTPGATPTTSTVSAPATPGGLCVAIYSTRSAELVWTHSATPGLLYEIRRNGRVIATTDGNRYRVASPSSGQACVFELVAIDRLGRRSATSTVVMRTVGGRTTIVGTSGGDAVDPATPTTPVISVSDSGAIERLHSSVYSPVAAGIP